MSNSSAELSTLRDDFLDSYYVHWPGEATTLGLHAFDDKLKDLSPEAIEDELQFHRGSRAAIGQLDMDTLTTEERLDAHMMSTVHDFHIRFAGENQDHRTNMMMSLYPYQLIQFQRRVSQNLDQWEALSSRVAGLPRYLKQQEALLREAARTGRTPDIDVASFITNKQIPHVVEFFETFAEQPGRVGVQLSASSKGAFHERCLAAAQAYTEHAAFLRETVCPIASVQTVGEEEYAWRLRTTLGVEAGIDEIIERARDILASLCDRLMTLVGTLNNGAVGSVQDALAFVMREKETPITERDEDVIDAYRALHNRAREHMREHALFHFGDEVDSLGFYPLPPAVAEMVALANIAAPLHDPDGQAFFLIQPKAGAHAKIQAPVLSVHEGLPGHGFQSIWWQTHRERRAHTVRFLCVPDEIALARQYFGAMMNIEGWATYAEALMAEHGFFSPRETLWAIWCQMAHASRVVVDASLHTNRMTVPEGVAFLSEQAGWPVAWAETELNRYRQVPLQAVCYLLGRLEILDLRERCRTSEGAAFNLADFHDRFFAAGPVAAGHLKKAWFPEG